MQFVPLKIIDAQNRVQTIQAKEGYSLLEVLQENNYQIEGACGGNMACATCHVILDSDVFEIVGSPCDEEQDMLDMAFGVEATSRLGCQVIVTKDLADKVIRLV